MKPDLAKQNLNGFDIKEGGFLRPTFACVLITFGTVPIEWVHAFTRMQNPVNSSSIFVSYKKMEIGVARCLAIQDILNMKVKDRPRYVLFLSDDDLMPWDGLIKLFVEMENNPYWDVLTSVVHLKNEGHAPSPVMWRWDTDYRRPLIPNKDFKVGDIVECDVANLGFGLMRPSVFEKISPPYFKSGFQVETLIDGRDGLTLTGEDCYFFSKLKAAGGHIGVHTGCRSSHLDVKEGVIY